MEHAIGCDPEINCECEATPDPEFTCSDCGEEVTMTHVVGYKTRLCDPCYRVSKGLDPVETPSEWIEDFETLSHL